MMLKPIKLLEVNSFKTGKYLDKYLPNISFKI